MTTERVTFPGAYGHDLSGRLEMPEGRITAWAVFAHCFTCSKDLAAARTIASKLADLGIAVLRFDFTGLGSSDGEFASTHFSSNVADLVEAARFLQKHHAAPSLLVGHSLGGTAVLCAAAQLPSVKAVATIGAPADAEHVTHQFGADIEKIQTEGIAPVKLAGRDFTIRREFLEDVATARVHEHLKSIEAALLVLHSPVDETVGIDNATALFVGAHHPKSFVSLDDADHLLTKARDAEYAARVIAGWADRYIGITEPTADDEEAHDIVVSETGRGKFQNRVQAGRHRMLADEPPAVGGTGTGPSPYEYLSAALGACTSMTLRIYADFKKVKLGRISVEVAHEKRHLEDAAQEISGRKGKTDVFTRTIRIEGGEPLDDAKVVEIADKCPVHRTLERTAHVETRVER